MNEVVRQTSLASFLDRAGFFLIVTQCLDSNARKTGPNVKSIGFYVSFGGM